MLVPNSNIKLNKLEVFQDEVQNTSTGDADDVVLSNDNNSSQPFAFEISNTTYQKGFDERGNKIVGDGSNSNGGNTQAKAAKIKAFAARVQPQDNNIPKVPDVEINLKEIK